MNQCDKTRFDVISHLTDIPMLGKQYVPELWKQIEGTSALQQQSILRTQPEPPINQRIYTPTIAQNTERGRQPHSSTSGENGFGGFGRTIEKRTMPSTFPSTSDSPPLSKIPRVEH